ncbi:MAG: hypothetical protein OK454_08955, partial [Thaumarchaeota archaeon]|nr:hypothetical protein [Nitrososphaerota archaeon]
MIGPRSSTDLMKLARRLSRHQLQVLRAVAEGRACYRWSSEWQCWERFYERWDSPQQGEKVWENHI